jgi:hypothetical protein
MYRGELLPASDLFKFGILPLNRALPASDYKKEENLP